MSTQHPTTLSTAGVTDHRPLALRVLRAVGSVIAFIPAAIMLAFFVSGTAVVWGAPPAALIALIFDTSYVGMIPYCAVPIGVVMYGVIVFQWGRDELLWG